VKYLFLRGAVGYYIKDGNFGKAADTVEQLKVRMEEYDKSTKPVIDFFEPLGVVSHINAGQAKDLVFAEVKKALEK
jgi:adenylate kinase